MLFVTLARFALRETINAKAYLAKLRKKVAKKKKCEEKKSREEKCQEKGLSEKFPTSTKRSQKVSTQGHDDDDSSCINDDGNNIEIINPDEYDRNVYATCSPTTTTAAKETGSNSKIVDVLDKKSSDLNTTDSPIKIVTSTTSISSSSSSDSDSSSLSESESEEQDSQEEDNRSIEEEEEEEEEDPSIDRKVEHIIKTSKKKGHQQNNVTEKILLRAPPAFVPKIEQ